MDGSAGDGSSAASTAASGADSATALDRNASPDFFVEAAGGGDGGGDDEAAVAGGASAGAAASATDAAAATAAEEPVGLTFVDVQQRLLSKGLERRWFELRAPLRSVLRRGEARRTLVDCENDAQLVTKLEDQVRRGTEAPLARRPEWRPGRLRCPSPSQCAHSSLFWFGCLRLLL
jgi:hypothetical protein